MAMKDSTLGGYLREHERPPSFQAADGSAYTVEIMTEPTGPDDGGPWSGYLFFVRWRGREAVGHVESGFLVESATEGEARGAIEKLELHEVKGVLDELVGS